MTVTAAHAVDLDIRRLSGTIGAELRGVDLKDPLSPETVAAIRAALLEHRVIFFPGQHLDPGEHVAFARYFGELTPAHPVIPGIDGFPEVFEIDYAASNTTFKGGGFTEKYDATTWHTDVTFMERPPLGSVLNAVVIPAAGGDTLFSDQRAADQVLSEPIRTLLDGLTAVHSGERQFRPLLERRGDGGLWEGEPITSLVHEHPVVRTHPETGKRSIFVNPGFTQRIRGMSVRESSALLKLLYDHSTQPEFTVRYHWEAGDLGFWDNRVTQHAVVRDFGGEARRIQRVTIRGDVPA